MTTRGSNHYQRERDQADFADTCSNIAEMTLKIVANSPPLTQIVAVFAPPLTSAAAAYDSAAAFLRSDVTEGEAISELACAAAQYLYNGIPTQEYYEGSIDTVLGELTLVEANAFSSNDDTFSTFEFRTDPSLQFNEGPSWLDSEQSDVTGYLGVDVSQIQISPDFLGYIDSAFSGNETNGSGDADFGGPDFSQFGPGSGFTPPGTDYHHGEHDGDRDRRDPPGEGAGNHDLHH